MESDLATSLITARTATTQQSIALAVVKKSHDMQMALVEMIDETARSAPPPGQGTVVDKVA